MGTPVMKEGTVASWLQLVSPSTPESIVAQSPLAERLNFVCLALSGLLLSSTRWPIIPNMAIPALKSGAKEGEAV